MKRPVRLIRLSDAFIPASLLIVALLGYGRNAALFFTCFLSTALLSLFSAEGLRIAFAAQPSLRGVRGSAKCALLLQAASLPLAMLIAWPLGVIHNPLTLPFLAAGALYNIEHTFYEYLYALGDKASAALSRALSALFLLTGLALSGSEATAFHPLWLAGLSLLSVLIAALISLVSGKFMQGRINSRVIASAPRAALQTLLYPVLFVPISLLPGMRGIAAAFFCGLLPWSLCRTPFRRSTAEAAPMNRALLAVCAVSAAVAAAAYWLFPSLPLLNNYAGFDLFTSASAVLLASLCCLLLYGNFRKEAD